MDNTLIYQDTIIGLLHEYADFWKTTQGIQNQVIIDKEHHYYQLLMVGWRDSTHYIHTTAFHFAIIEGKIWIHQNNTEALIADELVERGVAKSDIVLGFIAPEVRAYTGFAVA
ncbi:MAG: hypothetical protein RLZZ292_2688 [Bacteroidota bacterium]|jgi:hypothetical protein